MCGGLLPFSNSQFTFASNTATIIGGTLVGSSVQMRVVSIFVYAFFMTVRLLLEFFLLEY